MEMGPWARVQFRGYMQSSPKEAPGHAKNTLFPGKTKETFYLFNCDDPLSWQNNRDLDLELPGGALCVPTKLHSCQELV
jgi:hypothetical protein